MQEEEKKGDADSITTSTTGKPSPQTPSSWFLLMINIGMIMAGSMTTIFGKIIDQRVALPKASASGEMELVETEFKHPLIMNLLMFSGEATLLLALAFQLSKNP